MLRMPGLLMFALVVCAGGPAAPASAQKIFVDFNPSSAIGGSPDNWNQLLLADLAPMTPIPLIDETGAPTGIDFTYTRQPGSSYGAQNGVLLSSITPAGPPDAVPFGGNLSMQTIGRSLAFNGLSPGTDYKVWALTYAYPASFRTPLTFDITGAPGWTTLTTPEDTWLVINGELSTPTRTFESYAKTITAAPDGRLAFVAASGEFAGVYGFALEPIILPPTGTVTATPDADAKAEWNGVGFELTTDGTTIGAQHIDFIDLDRRMVMEFPLDQVPSNATVTAASLSLDVSSITFSDPDYPTLQLYAYNGDGVVDAGDPSLGVFVAESDPVLTPDPIEIALDADEITTLLASGATHLGLVGRSGPTGRQINATSQEGSDLGIGFAPTLELSYTTLAALPADLSGDGDVDDEDLGLFFSAFTGPDAGPPASPDADLSGDGDVDDEDLGLAFSAFTGPGSPINIPEPAGLALLGVIGLPLLARRRYGCHTGK